MWACVGEKKKSLVFCVPVTNSSHTFQSPLGTNTPMLSAARLSVNPSSCPDLPSGALKGGSQRRGGDSPQHARLKSRMAAWLPCLVSFPESSVLFFLVLSLVLLASGERAHGVQFLEVVSIWMHVDFWVASTTLRIEKQIPLFSCFHVCCCDGRCDGRCDG